MKYKSASFFTKDKLNMMPNSVPTPPSKVFYKGSMSPGVSKMKFNMFSKLMVLKYNILAVRSVIAKLSLNLTQSQLKLRLMLALFPVSDNHP